VLGAVLLGIIVLFVSCSGGGDDDKKKPGSSAGSQFPTPAPASSTPDDEPSLVDVPPGAGNPSLPDPEDLESGAAVATPTGGAIPSGAATGTGTTTGGADTNVNVPASGDCTTKEVSVTPIPAVTTLKRGAQVEIRLKIKNVSTRTCNRDVGADLQELYIQSGAHPGHRRPGVPPERRTRIQRHLERPPVQQMHRRARRRSRPHRRAIPDPRPPRRDPQRPGHPHHHRLTSAKGRPGDISDA
jgi:hypothetical protein